MPDKPEPELVELSYHYYVVYAHSWGWGYMEVWREQPLLDMEDIEATRGLIARKTNQRPDEIIIVNWHRLPGWKTSPREELD